MKEKNWHDKSYKILLLIPIIIILFSLIYITITYQQTGDLFKKDISLTGGTSITIYDQISANSIKLDLSEKLQNLNAREIYDFGTEEQKALIIETTSDWEISKNVLEEYLGYALVEGENSDIEFTGSILSQSFYNQLLIAILVAFLFMAIVVFIIFRNFVPSMAVILSAFADILMTLAVVDLFGLKKIRGVLGCKMRLAISCGASLDLKIIKFILKYLFYLK